MLGKPQNWEKFGIKVGKVRVEKTTKHIIVHTGQIAGVHPNHALIEAGSIIGTVLGVLRTLGVFVESGAGVPLRRPIFKFYTADAELLYEHACMQILESFKIKLLATLGITLLFAESG